MPVNAMRVTDLILSDGHLVEEETLMASLPLKQPLNDAVSEIVEDNKADLADEQVRLEAWDHLKRIKEIYRLFTEKILDTKEKELDTQTEEIKKGHHRDLESGISSLRTQCQNVKRVAENRFFLQRRGIETEHEASLHQIKRQFQIRKADLRESMISKLLFLQFQLKQDMRAYERSRVGERISRMSTLFDVRKSENDKCGAVSLPIVDQSNWQNRENVQFLQAVQPDRFGSSVPPSLYPGSLHKNEVEQDLDRFKNAPKILERLSHGATTSTSTDPFLAPLLEPTHHGMQHILNAAVHVSSRQHSPDIAFGDSCLLYYGTTFNLGQVICVHDMIMTYSYIGTLSGLDPYKVVISVTRMDGSRKRIHVNDLRSNKYQLSEKD